MFPGKSSARRASDVPVYVSTSCLEGSRTALDIVCAFTDAGLHCIEIGPTAGYDGTSTDRFKAAGADFLVHHYFPPPPEPLVVNLASADPDILARSRRQVETSLDFCAALGVPLFSLHAGFRADPDIDFNFDIGGVHPYEEAFETFVVSVRDLAARARKLGIRLAVENNVLSDYNVIEGANPFLLMCRAEEFLRFHELLDDDNVGILLDLGHLKVTARWLGFSAEAFVETVADRVFMFHVHENHGLKDEHLPLAPSSWALSVVCQPRFAGLPVVLETHHLGIDAVVEQVRLVASVLPD